MNLTKGQEEALIAIKKVQKSHPGGGGIVVIAGAAGTGKSSFLSVLSDEYPGTFVLTPTGRAALRVKEVANCDAYTIHKWMYNAVENPKTEEVTFSLRGIGEVKIPPNGLVIVDEASMLGSKIFKELYQYTKALGLNLILIGDHFQLQPVENENGFSVFAENFPADYKVTLTEVLRQALESTIGRVCTSVRVDKFYLEALRELPQVSYDCIGMEACKTWRNGGVVICHKNQTRYEINAKARAAESLPEEPISGEPLLILKNDYKLDIYNGEVVEAEDNARGLGPIVVTDRYMNVSTEANLYLIDIRTPQGIKPIVVTDKELNGDKTVRPVCLYNSVKNFVKKKQLMDKSPSVVSASFGYCLTAHKMQGSQTPQVTVVIEDSCRPTTYEGRRWIYTAITRAERNAIICWK
jgi:exodeoxyribonuclease-5